jgi:membrane carboxypeptidase/penicillin-binding protein
MTMNAHAFRAKVPGLLRNSRGNIATTVILSCLVLAITAMLAGVLLLYSVVKDLPTLDILKNYRPSIITTVYSKDQEVIDEFYLED